MINNIEFANKVIEGQEHLPLSQRKYPHPETGEPMSYAGYMKYVDEGKAPHPDELWSIRIKFHIDVQDEDGTITRYHYDKTKSTKGPIEVEQIFADEGNEEWRQYEPENLQPIEGQEDLPLSKRKYVEPYTGDHVSYSVYMRHVKEDPSVPHPMELYDERLVRNPKELRKNQKDLPNSKQLFMHPDGVQEFGYIGYGTYMKLVNENKAIHPDKI